MKGPLKSAMRVLPPDVFDALELSALAFGGIGGETFAVGGGYTPKDLADSIGCPNCPHGHGAFLDGREQGGVRWALAGVGIDYPTNDAAVRKPRIPFEEWCRRLNVVRADTPTYDAAFVALVSSQTKKERGAGKRGAR